MMDFATFRFATSEHAGNALAQASERLNLAFDRWQARLDRACRSSHGLGEFDWQAYHEMGLELTRCLARELCQPVWYEAPAADQVSSWQGTRLQITPSGDVIGVQVD